MNSHNFIYNGNELFAFGNNYNGQLGLGDYENRNIPTLVMRDKTIRQVACGRKHTFILKKSGELYAFGCNEFGQLGLNDNKNRNKPTLVIQDKTIQRVVCGNNFSILSKESGKVFVFGGNHDGQLGLGDNMHRSIPTLLMQDEKIQQIVCGGYYTFILKKSGELFAFGKNKFGQLGLGDKNNKNEPRLVVKDKEIRQIICGEDHTFILKRHNKLFGFGNNLFGQLGLKDNVDRNIPTLITIPKFSDNETKNESIRQITCGKDHTLILKKQGELFGFGSNFHGQLNLNGQSGLDDDMYKYATSYMIKDHGIRQIICAGHYSFMLKQSGELFGFGRNSEGQLGLGNYKNTNIPKPLMIIENIISINGIIVEKIKWDPNIYSILSQIKRTEIKNFLLVCHCYKQIHGICMVKYMRHMIISLLF